MNSPVARRIAPSQLFSRRLIPRASLVAAAVAIGVSLSASGDTWTNLSPTGTPPVARSRHSSVYDPGPNRLIVFGGQVEEPDGCTLNPRNDT